MFVFGYYHTLFYLSLTWGNDLAVVPRFEYLNWYLININYDRRSNL